MSHDKTDSGGGACHKTKGLAASGVEGFFKDASRAGGIGKFQVAGFADIELACIFIGKFKGCTDGIADVGDAVTADDDIVSVAAPAFCVSGKINREDFGVGGFHGLIHGGELACSSGTGAEKPQRVIAGPDIHRFQKSIVHTGDTKADGVQHGGADKFCSFTIHADLMDIHGASSLMFGGFQGQKPYRAGTNGFLTLELWHYQYM